MTDEPEADSSFPFGVEFIDGGSVETGGASDALTRGLEEFEKRLEEKMSNVGQPVVLGLVSITSIGAMGAFTVELVQDVPVGVKYDFMNGFEVMVGLIIEDIRQGNERSQELTGDVGKDFIGWVVSAEGLDTSNNEARMTAFYNMGTGAFWARHRIRGEEVTDEGWGYSDKESLGDAGFRVYGALKRLTEVSHYLRIKRDLLNQ